MDIAKFWDEQAAWSRATFGADHERGPIGPLKHLLKEVKEATAKPTDVTEFADMLFLIFDASRRAGNDFDHLDDDCGIAYDAINELEGLESLAEDALDEAESESGTGTKSAHLRGMFQQMVERWAMACWKAGFTFDAVLKAAFDKLEVNKTRTWGPKTAGDEPVEHVRGNRGE